ncbi:NADP-dependent oxidoreductase domain-containing protein [Apiospora hydei]|uniref:NADP-dependent oxidoreductase domain-containing protein n=1 Tax=Apiospora hydei TaxID=1337664 RepID=A0ABR1WNP5_9PEZI
MALPQYFTLNNGEKVPAVALGTFQSDDGNSRVAATVKMALELGYRHVDGAATYANEREIGLGIKSFGVPRSEIFVTSKLPQTAHHPGVVAKALQQTLSDLGLEYVDLYLMHFPHAYKADNNLQTIRHPSGNNKPVIDYELSRYYAATWKAMEALVESGKARSIGLSNFNILKTRKLLETANIIPAVNQVELHPYLPQAELVAFSRKHGILVIAHQPLEAVLSGPYGPMKGSPDLLKMTRSGALRFLDPKPHIGFDIFDEENDQPIDNKAPWD